ncbi:LysR family transcriptional regulator ArgP [Georgenia alba]|uniref:LysR family transcriptional regulator ArgP n=1 Tax=Georgenia alba TaxID=2233858 RepID=A0ABW2QBI5_9MICO
MQMRPEQLAALVAIVDHGTFDAAARHLSVTPSAVSQRVRALESEVGRVLLVRSTPVRTTAAGAVLLRLARQQLLLEREALTELAAGESAGGAARVDLPLAVNADSLATWFTAAVHACAAWPGITLRLHVEDQDHSAALLRAGAVLGAITSDPVPVQGCDVERLGVMRYLPVATAEIAERHSRGRGYDWAEMPMIRFNDKDDLQHRVLAAHGVDAEPPTHYVPSSQAFVDAVYAGLGWGMVPEDQMGDGLATGRLVRLGARARADVPLYWQRWRLRSTHVERLTGTVRDAARVLRR